MPSMIVSRCRQDGIHPPVPDFSSVDEPDESRIKGPAQRILALVRLLEQESTNFEEHMDEITELMNVLIAKFSRRGLLQGDNNRATKILSSKTKESNEKSKKKRKPGKKDLKMHDGVGEEAESVGSQAESLLFTALTRILNDSNNSLKSNKCLQPEYGFLIALCAETTLSISQHIKLCSDTENRCIRAEFEILTEFGKPLLSSLAVALQWALASIKESQTASGVTSHTGALPLDETQHTQPIVSCLKAACSLVGLFGTKLSRSTALLATLKDLSWEFLSVACDRVQQAAAKLLGCLPLAGGVDRKSASHIWNAGINDILVMIPQFIDSVVPVNKPQQSDKADLSEVASKRLNQWVSSLRDIVLDEESRVSSFRWTLQGLVFTLREFLMRETSGQLLEAELDIDAVIDVIERFVSYPLSAETHFFRTKKRLRDEVVDGGLISCRAIATKLANSIKVLGHLILDVLLDSVGSPTLLPYAGRLMRISYASLLTCCTGAVRSVMDSSSVAQLEGKKRRWLHLSIPVRNLAVKAVNSVIVMFGSDQTAKTSDKNIRHRSNGDMSLGLVGGCLLEQINLTQGGDFHENWGTPEERIALISSCLECLRGALSSSGGFMSIPTRSMIDSIVLKCLTRQTTPNRHDVFCCTAVTVQVFELGRVCLATTWSDGGGTTLQHSLAEAAMAASENGDRQVGLTVKGLLRDYDLYNVPSGPALIYVTREEQDAGNSGKDMSAGDVIDSIEKAAIEARKLRDAAEQAERQKAQEKRKRNEERELALKKKRTETPKKQLPLPSIEVETATETKTKTQGSQEGDKQSVVVAEQHTVQETLPGDTRNKSEQITEPETLPTPPEASTEAPDRGDAMDIGREDKGLDLDDDEDFPDIVEGGPDSDDE